MFESAVFEGSPKEVQTEFRMWQSLLKEKNKSITIISVTQSETFVIDGSNSFKSLTLVILFLTNSILKPLK